MPPCKILARLFEPTATELRIVHIQLRHPLHLGMPQPFFLRRNCAITRRALKIGPGVGTSLSLSNHRLAQLLARCFPNRRDPVRIAHTFADKIRARIFAIGCGYEDADDLDFEGRTRRRASSAGDRRGF